MRKRILKRGLQKLRLFETDAADLIRVVSRTNASANTTSTFLIPGGRRHHKRRLFTPEQYVR
jgi:tRNA G46 methylase TrmB